MSKTIHVSIVIIASLAAIVSAFSFVPVAQDLAYHNFADGRAFLGIANFGDVAGNLPFTFFGLMGLCYLYGNKDDNPYFSMKGEAFLWKVFFFGATLVGLGSGYYHLNPNNTTLVWDRLPMTIAFMSFFLLVIMERINAKSGLMLFPLLLMTGVCSVFYWDYTESLGMGDLRLYALVQFLPLVLIPLMLWLFPALYTGIRYLGFTLGWYILAKFLEHFDDTIFDLLGDAISGHTLKHLAAAMGVYTMILYIKKRKVLSIG